MIATRRGLHAVAEHLIAGAPTRPQRAFRNAPFGVAVPARALAGEGLGQLFAEGRRLTAG